MIKVDIVNEVSKIADITKVKAEVFDLDLAATCEDQRTQANERMADLFDDVDFVICATNPDVAFPAEIGLNTRVGNLSVGPENNGALTIPANIVGNPAISIPDSRRW
jgi:aspartyl-tRNA(Asn)/glutamyl-tRNA(Gln) amidotransferase subunit A